MLARYHFKNYHYHPSIDVRHWQRDSLLIPYQSFNQQWFRHGKVAASIEVCTEPDRVLLTHHQSSSEDWEDESYPVYLDWTNCNLGGQRPWFLCPVFGCNRRVAILYEDEGGIFACRHCCQLAYSCQREGNFLRALRRADKIFVRLGGETTGIFPRYARKPKGMHWST